MLQQIIMLLSKYQVWLKAIQLPIWPSAMLTHCLTPIPASSQSLMFRSGQQHVNPVQDCFSGQSVARHTVIQSSTGIRNGRDLSCMHHYLSSSTGS